MKKLFLILLCFLLILSTLSGCRKASSKFNISNDDIDKKDNTKNTSVNLNYDDDKALFVGKDRYDIEGDRYSVYYYYNYKGELLENNNSYIGYYSENGLAPAVHKSTGKIGFVNKKGEFVIDPIYDDACAFSKHGIAPVMLESDIEGDDVGEYWGFIDSKGNVIVDIVYPKVSSFYDSGYALIAINEPIDVEEENGDVYTTTSTLYGIIDKSGKIIVKPEYDKILYIYNDYFIVFKYGEEGGLSIYGLDGKILVNSTDLSSGHVYFNAEGIFRISNDDSNSKTFKYELFDGQRFVDYKVNYEITSKKVATTVTGNGYGIIQNNKTVIPFEYDEIIPVNDYFVCIKYLNSNSNYINPRITEQTIDIYNSEFVCTGKNLDYNYYPTSETSWNYFSETMPNGFFEVWEEDKNNPEDPIRGVIDEKGNVIVEIAFCRGITPMTYEATAMFPTNDYF